MGSRAWLKNIIPKKKGKGSRSEKFQGCSEAEDPNRYSTKYFSELKDPRLVHGASLENHGHQGMLVEDIAATRIQSAFRAYRARKSLRRLRGVARLKNLVQCDSVKKQASATLTQLHSWNRIQDQIRDRRAHMVTEGKLRQKKLENQMKLGAKLHELEVEWNSGSETMDMALARIHHREEAALRRERAMAYAFSHQWRANSSPSFGSENPDLSKANWGWSWKDRWIAARPWESRAMVQSTPKKKHSHPANKTSPKSDSPKVKTPLPLKSISPNGKGASKPRKLSYEGAQKMITQKDNVKAGMVGTKKVHAVS